VDEVVAPWNEFIFAVIFIPDEGKRTLPLGVMKFVGDVCAEKFIKGMSAGAVKG
jgi:ABC-type glycerol-3-phosphate transport system permease component